MHAAARLRRLSATEAATLRLEADGRRSTSGEWTPGGAPALAAVRVVTAPVKVEELPATPDGLRDTAHRRFYLRTDGLARRPRVTGEAQAEADALDWNGQRWRVREVRPWRGRGAGDYAELLAVLEGPA